MVILPLGRKRGFPARREIKWVKNLVACGRVFYRLAQKSLTLLITLYRYIISPVLGQHCRFYPSCSVYAKTAIEEFGIARGLFCAVKRLLCCHPWHPGGFDPVPTQTKRILEEKK